MNVGSMCREQCHGSSQGPVPQSAASSVTRAACCVRRGARRTAALIRSRYASIVVVLAFTACNDSAELDRTIALEAASFEEIFRLERVITPEQSPQSPIVRISGAAWNADGFAIADVSESNVKVYDNDGILRAIMGRKGEGPGEFLSARHLDAYSGLLYLADGSRGRISAWSWDGLMVEEVAFQAGFISDFAILSTGRFAMAGKGFGQGAGESYVEGDGSVGVFGTDGLQVAQGIHANQALPANEPRDLPWRNMQQTYFAVVHDTAWVVSSISDTLWVASLNADTLVAESYRLDIPGYVAPSAPEKPLQSVRDLSEWGKSFHGASRAVSSSQLLVFPFVRGVLNYGDPTIVVLRDQRGLWHALHGAPPVVAAYEDRLLAIHNPLEEHVELAIYEMRR